MDAEKITINIGAVDLGQIDLLVEQGFYTNRTDFLRTAIRNQIGTHGEVLNQLRRSSTFGVDILDRELRKLETLDGVAPLPMIGAKFDGMVGGTGVFIFSKNELEQVKASGNKIALKLVGMLVIASDVTPELAKDVFGTVKVFGIIKAPEAVKEVLLNQK